jgi:subtilisin family serine protease
MCIRTQVLIPANTRADLGLIQKDFIHNKGIPSKDILDRFALYLNKGIYYVSFLGEKKVGFLRSELALRGIICGAEIGPVVSLRIPITELKDISGLKGLRSIQLAGKIRPLIVRETKVVKSDSAPLGISLPKGYSGKNVLIGITDWGFDYSSPLFYDTLLRQTRILAAWDQFKSSGPPPSGYTYGTEYSSLPEYHDIGTDTLNHFGYAAHGTQISGIAGGSGAGTPYRGIAFDSQFLFASFLADEASVLDAWEWMYQKSLSESKRLVIHLSWAVYTKGTLDGTSLLSQAIDAYSFQGVIFCNAAGNDGDVNFHIKKDFSNDSILTTIRFNDDKVKFKLHGQTVYAWGEAGNSFECGLQVYSSNGNILLYETPYYSTATTVNYIDTFIVLNRDTIYYNLSADASHPQNGRPQMRLGVNTNSSLRVLLKSHSTFGRVHYWNVTEKYPEMGRDGMPFDVSGKGTVAGDKTNGISEPSCTNSIISVAAYVRPFINDRGVAAGGTISSFSSIGPRYDGVLKPEIAAPGENVLSSLSSCGFHKNGTMASEDLKNRSDSIASFSGMSIAASVVTGVIALILEANPYLSSEQIKHIITETASEDQFTGVVPINGSPQWGWGKIDPITAVKLALITVGTESTELEIDWAVFPYPVNNRLFFTIVDELPKQVQLTDVHGKTFTRRIENDSLYVGDLNQGTYFIRIERKGRIQQTRFVKN